MTISEWRSEVDVILNNIKGEFSDLRKVVDKIPEMESVQDQELALGVLYVAIAKYQKDIESLFN